METKHTAFHWPDHVIGKRESRQIREEHNALYNDFHEILGALHTLITRTPLHKLNIRKDFSLINAHAQAIKTITKVTTP